jgi:Kef-type K+ transport system membrane component KefB
MLFAAGGGVEESTIAFVFIDIAVIMVVARLVGALFRRFGQPPVIGEIIAGLVLGPSLLGADWVTDLLGLDESLTDLIFPTEARAYLKVLAELGLVLFMFIVGLELDLKLIRGKERLAAGISLTSVALPFTLGFGLAGILDGQGYRPDGIDFLPFALFIGASMSVTAFPVLARVLSERGMQRTPTGTLSLACAAIDDILAWSLLALVTAIVEASLGGGGNAGADLARVLGLSVAFIAFMFVVVRPQLARLPARFRRNGDSLTPEVLVVVLGGLLISSYITSEIGIHSIFGAFLWGAVMPREDAAEFTHALLERIESVAVLLLLPLFFIVTGLNADIGSIGAGDLAAFVLIVVVACVGKFVGATAAGRFQGLSMRRAAAVGTLMNTRGLTELVLLSIGLDKGVLSPELFTMLVLMAIVTTVMTAPMLKQIYPDRMVQHDIAEAERAALGDALAYRVLVLVDTPDTAGPVVDAACQIAASESPAEVVLSRFQPQPRPLEAGAGAYATQLALMAETIDDLRGLEERVRANGLTAVSFSQFTADLPGDLAGQAERLGARVVLIGDQRDEPEWDAQVAALRSLVPCDMALVVAPLPRPDQPAPTAGPVVAAGDGPDAMAALELAARMAATTGSPPRLVGLAGVRGGRRMQGLLRRLAGDGDAPASIGGDLDDPSTVAAVHGASAAFVGFASRQGGGPTPVQAARPDAERFGFPIVLVQADPNRLDRSSLEAFLDQRATSTAPG